MKSYCDPSLKGKKLCIIDIDGTFLRKFTTIFNTIIEELFGKNILVRGINLLFNRINDLDIISNSMFMFKFVMLIYSILSFTNFKQNCAKYEERYYELAKKGIKSSYDDYVAKLEELGYYVLFVSHNVYTHRFEILGDRIITPKNKRRYLPKYFQELDVRYVIGNNYMDDIVSGMRLNKKYRKAGKPEVTIMYLGHSSIIKNMMYKKVNCFLGMSQVVAYIKELNN
ncbi:MAG: hypothetical protein PHP54_04870 [Clostridia bacterium]|nr:hypothetical protein [Clostridia bacterium]